MRKRFLSLVIGFCTVGLLTLPACAAQEGGAPDQTGPTSNTDVFTDVPDHAWYAEAVNYCSEQGILSGTTCSTFSPTISMTRAMLAAVFYRMAGSPTATANPNFTDAAGGTWYSEEISWASQTGILSGKGNNWFAPKANVTRGEVAVILHQYMDRKQEDAPTLSDDILVISVGGKHFTARLEENASARMLAEMLPMMMTMVERNGNEKYCYLPELLPATPERPRNIQAGYLMLYGSDCLVLVYENFVSAYTRLGRIDDPDGLAEALGSGDMEMTFQLQSS